MKIASDSKMKVCKTETITGLSDQNDINRIYTKHHPRNLPSHQGRQMQKHTIHPLRKETGGVPNIFDWFGHGEWKKFNSNVSWLDLWYLNGFELTVACGESKCRLKGNMINSEEKEVRHRYKTSAWCRVWGGQVESWWWCRSPDWNWRVSIHRLRSANED